MASDPPVTVLATSFIVPASPTPNGHLFLPSVDAFWQERGYARNLIFFASAPADAVETLKTSLSLALVYYYPSAGRLALGEDGRLVIDCNSAGVEFVEATIDCALSDHAKTGFQIMAFYEQLCREVDHQGQSLYTSSLLSLQVTRFSDGGLAVAVAHSHVLADGLSLCTFMMSWGELARGKALAVVPMHDRERLALPHPSAEKAKLAFERIEEEEEEEEEEEGGEERGHVVETRDGPDEPEIKTDGHDEPLVQCVFVMPSGAVQQLRVLVGATHSSYVAICAHLWKRVTAACRPTRGDTTRFETPADLRGRWEPALPPAYFGNMLAFCRVKAPGIRVATEPFHVTARRVQLAVASALERERLLGIMHWLKLHGNKFSNSDVNLAWAFPGITMAGSPRLPVYDVDYGWGRPAAVRAVKVLDGGQMVLYPGRPGSPAGDVEICTALPAPVLRRLLKDPDFLAHALTNPFANEDVG